MTSILALFVLLVGGGALVAQQVINTQYYVGTSRDKVTIFRGLDQKLLGISLSSVYQRTNIPVSGITSTSAQAIKQEPAGSLAQADHFVANIRNGYNTCQAAYKAVRQWVANKPKPIPIRNKRTGQITGYRHPKYPPRPTIPGDCPPMPGQ
jgi:protein phosphatase